MGVSSVAQALEERLIIEGKFFHPSKEHVIVLKEAEKRIILKRPNQIGIFLATGLLRYSLSVVLRDRSPQSVDALFFDLKEFLKGQGCYNNSDEAFDMLQLMHRQYLDKHPGESVIPVYRIIQHVHDLLDQLLANEMEQTQEALS